MRKALTGTGGFESVSNYVGIEADARFDPV